MNKSYVTPTKLACLATVCGICALTSVFDAVLLSIIGAAIFIIGIAVISFLENITNSHIRFVVFALIAAAFITIIKFIFNYVGSVALIRIALNLDYVLLSILVLSIMPIYFMHKATTQNYYLTSVWTSLLYILFSFFIGAIVEILGSGTFANIGVLPTSYELFATSFIGFIILALCAVIGSEIEILIRDSKRNNRLLIEKYKYIIRESQIGKLQSKVEESKTKVFEVGGDNNGRSN